MRWRGTRGGAATTAPPADGDVATEDDVRLLYRWILGREASEPEVAGQLQGEPTLRKLIDVITASAEFAARDRVASARREGRDRYANLWRPEVDSWTHPVGLVSDDGVAIVGHEGTLFIVGGTNDAREHHLGRAALPEHWLEDWREVVAQRGAGAAALGAPLAQLVVPDKLAALERRYPGALEPVGPRPVQRLLADGLPLLYPLAELQRDGAYLRTDSHLTLAGNLALYETVVRGWGIDDAPDPLAGVTVQEYMSSGDLGARLHPEALEVMPGVPSTPASLVHDSRAQVAAAGRFVGTRRVWRRPDAPVDGVAVVFGDSYAFGEAGYQGLAFLLAQVVSEVHFAWAPFGWDPGYATSIGATLVVCQTAERFLPRVPPATVDVLALERDAIEGRRP